MKIIEFVTNDTHTGKAHTTFFVSHPDDGSIYLGFTGPPASAQADEIRAAFAYRKNPDGSRTVPLRIARRFIRGLTETLPDASIVREWVVPA